MYFEEQLINGILCWRSNPKHDFTPYTQRELTVKYMDEKTRKRIDWIPWSQAKHHVGEKILLKFDSGHIEDAVIFADRGIEGEVSDPYYVLFDGEALLQEPIEFCFID